MSANEKNYVQQQHDIIGYAKNDSAFKRTDSPDAQWFYKPVQLGLFIHFGISTVGGDIDISWGMMDNPERRKKGNGILTPREYWKLAENFNPDKYNPEEWLSKAKEAGFTYAVFTTRHHDGFAMWPSDAGDFSTKNYMNGRDLVGEYVKACRKVGLRVGLYYSPPDWRFNQKYMSFMAGSKSAKYPERENEGIDHEVIGDIPEMPDEHYEKFAHYINAQVRELLTRYGKIDLIWFDGTTKDTSKIIKPEEIRALQPGIIINDRLYGVGDYSSGYECHLPDTKPDTYWETAQIWHVGGGWSYVKNADKYRALDITMHQYEVARAFGGNLLLNIAPRADGSVPEAYYTSAKEFYEKRKEIYGE